MRVPRILLALAALAAGVQATDEVKDLVIERGEDEPALVLPADERLDFNVRIDVAVVGQIKVGNFRLRSIVTHGDEGEVLEGEVESGRIVAEAWGEHLGYELDHQIQMLWRPQDWPRVVYTDRQRGSENRERELQFGVFEGKPFASYQSDRHCRGCNDKDHFNPGNWFHDSKHCRKCKKAEHRVLRDPKTREIPEGALDMLGAVYLARQMVREGVERLEFPLLDRDDTWELELRQGSLKKRKVPAGSFLCREMKMVTRSESKGGKFEGLFGIQGTISIWLDAKTGVPVEISGTVPLGPMKLEVSIGLSKYRGTPEGFGE